ncbi:glycosyl transferase family 2 [Taibaiella sp. KBW10]|uniref:glycosyltransferase n=1 Tax=Taibaiella sp. KBW10 TaxID=2153357 RepID=UPI000F59456C|nr:glycosyltransferase [Taibaiella sp. KBW10]RQO31916.1 glycosyl transferase family 2 [Taibaiella sp. KBW10]
MTLPVLSCSIVLYNNDHEVLSNAIKSVLQCGLVQHLYLIDHSPKPLYSDTFDDKRVHYQFMDTNKGYGAGHNIALHKSIAQKTPYHLVLNPDVHFDSGTLECLMAYLSTHPDVGNIMPKVLYPDGRLQYLCKLLPSPYDWIGRRFNPVKKMVDKRNELFELRFSGYNKIMEVPYLSGCFMLLNMKAIKETGFFDEQIFMYGEETDLCRRLIATGYKTIFFPDATIYHAFEKGSHKSFRLTKIGMQSAVYYFNKWGWFCDKERKRINAKTLSQLAYNR